MKVTKKRKTQEQADTVSRALIEDLTAVADWMALHLIEDEEKDKTIKEVAAL
jgi:hypothetical protein